MLLFGHLGCGLCAGLLFSFIIEKAQSKTYDKQIQIDPLSKSANPQQQNSTKKESLIDSLSRRLDIRLLIIGSLLPDIIDKPLGHYILPHPFDGGRIFTHTLLFLIIITLAALYARRTRSKTWLYTLAFGIFIHLITDEMWLGYKTLFWPLFGIAFKSNTTDWVNNMLDGLLSAPSVYVPEALGLLVMLWFAFILIRRKKVFAFIKYGRIS